MGFFTLGGTAVWPCCGHRGARSPRRRAGRKPAAISSPAPSSIIAAGRRRPQRHARDLLRAGDRVFLSRRRPGVSQHPAELRRQGWRARRKWRERRQRDTRRGPRSSCTTIRRTRRTPCWIARSPTPCPCWSWRSCSLRWRYSFRACFAERAADLIRADSSKRARRSGRACAISSNAYRAAESEIAPMPAATLRPRLASMLSGCNAN